MTSFDQYMVDALSGQELVCQYVNQAIVRHNQDLAKQDDESFPYYFSPEYAEAAIKVIGLLRHTRGKFAKKPFGLQPFQIWMVSMLFGWRRKADDCRRFQQAYIETAKKSGKSELAAAILIAAVLMDREYGAQCYVAATKRDQALHVFNAAKTMCRFLREDSAYYRKEITVRENRIVFRSTGATIETLTSDYNSMDGIDTHIGVIDEYHAHKTSFVSDTILNSMVARTQPLHLTITTAGFNRYGPCYMNLRETGVRILRGQAIDDTFFVAIFTLDSEEDWDKPEKWYMANPCIGRTTSMQNLMMLMTKAKNEGSTKIVDFKTKNMNLWVSSADTWIPYETVKPLKITPEELEKIRSMPTIRCFGGLDLGQTRDMTVFAKLYDPEPLGFYYFEIYCWSPEEQAELRQEQGDPYMTWAEQGFLEITPGNTTDYDYVSNLIVQQWEKHDFWSIEYDPANATQLVINLYQHGVEMRKYSQTAMNMNAPTREFEEICFGGEFRHNDNPLMFWHLANVELLRDSNGNIKVSRKTKHKKVDAVVACIMALAGYMTYRHQKLLSYEQGVRTVSHG